MFIGDCRVRVRTRSGHGGNAPLHAPGRAHRPVLPARIGVLLVVWLWLLLAGPPAQAQLAQVLAPAASAGAPATAPAAPAPAPAPVPIPVSEIVVQAQDLQGHLGDIEEELANEHGLDTQSDDLAALIVTTNVRIREARALLNARPSLETLRSLEPGWDAAENTTAALTRDLTRRAGEFEHTLDELGQRDAVWQATSKSALAAAAPAEVTARIDDTLKSIDKTRADVQQRRAQILALQSKAADLSGRIEQTRDSLAAESKRAVSRLLQRDSQPLWTRAYWMGLTVAVAGAGTQSAGAQLATLHDYTAARLGLLAFHALLALALVAVLYRCRQRLRGWVDASVDLKQAAQILETPIATGVVIALAFSRILYPEAPLVFGEILGLVGIVPIVAIVKRLIQPPLRPILYTLGGFYLVDRLRGLTAAAHALARLILIVELAVALVLLFSTLRSARAAAQLPGTRPGKRWRLLKWAGSVAFAVALIALSADLAGYAQLGSLLGDALLRGAYFALVLYALTQVAEGLIFGLSHVPPLRYLAMFRNHRALISSRIARLLGVGAALLWILAMIRIVGLWDAANDLLDATLAAAVHVGSVAISVQQVIGFCVAIAGALWLARFVAFLLDEEVYPKLAMERGLPYLISTLLRYAILLCGFVFALATLGIDMTKFTILAGAFSVGLGFGLQNIVNNFVSGLIVLFERPMKIGDVVQFGDVLGQVERIGIRASVIRAANGAEVIIPNGTLISSNLTNWTFSNKSRRLDVPVQVALDSAPERVKAVLLEAALAHAAVSREPPPQALLTKLGPDTLEFELRVWCDAATDLAKVRSEIVSTIEAGLKHDAINLK